MSAQQSVVDKNYEAFKDLLPDLIKDNLGKHALMRDGKVVEIFDTARDAMRAGNRLFPDGGSEFSIQEITQKPVNLGYWSSYA